MNEPREIFVRLDRCMACHSCEIACATEHSSGKQLYQALFEEIRPKQRLYVESVSLKRGVPVLCRHCEDAPCMHACIAGAIKRGENGALLTDPDKCIGCWTCVMVCPYGVIGRHLQQHKAYRCDRCPDRDEPACVAACPTKALVYQHASEYSAQIRRSAADQLTADGKGAGNAA